MKIPFLSLKDVTALHGADSNFYMEFPTTCKVLLEIEGGDYELDMTTIDINVDTDKFYE